MDADDLAQMPLNYETKLALMRLKIRQVKVFLNQQREKANMIRQLGPGNPHRIRFLNELLQQTSEYLDEHYPQSVILMNHLESLRPDSEDPLLETFRTFWERELENTKNEIKKQREAIEFQDNLRRSSNPFKNPFKNIADEKNRNPNQNNGDEGDVKETGDEPEDDDDPNDGPNGPDGGPEPPDDNSRDTYKKVARWICIALAVLVNLGRASSQHIVSIYENTRWDTNKITWILLSVFSAILSIVIITLFFSIEMNERVLALFVMCVYILLIIAEMIVVFLNKLGELRSMRIMSIIYYVILFCTLGYYAYLAI